MAAAASVASCALAPPLAPALDAERTRAIAIVGYVRSGAYYAEEPCTTDADDAATGLVCVNFDPPPLRLVIEVESVVSGERMPRRIVTVTGAHFGLDRYPVGPEHRSLYIVWTDGAAYGIPRYAAMRVVETRAGEWALPLWHADEAVWMLPCEASAGATSIDFRGSAARERIATNPEYCERALRDDAGLARHGDWVYPTRGIPLDAVRAALARRPLTAERVQCGKED